MPDHTPDPTTARLNFTGEISVADRTAACKAHLKHAMDRVKTLHEGGALGLETASFLAEAVDVMLTKLYDFAIGSWEKTHGKLPSSVSLIALGGYGRAELSPHSDIDLMFLFPARVRPSLIKPLQEHLTNEILYPLWDCGLKVGHSTRTVDEVFTEARAEIQSKTAMLETRRIAGSKTLFDTFSTSYRNYYTREDPGGYIADRLKDQAERRAKYGDSVFLQEPDIKNGVGGLRDFQNTIWMARVKLDIFDEEELVKQRFLRASELSEFQNSYQFLLRVRAELHFQSKRPTDLLDLEAQPRIALGLGYAHEDMLQRVEAFMRDYYRAAQTIYRSSKLVENRLALNLEARPGAKISFRDIIRSRRYERVKRIDGFRLRGNELSADSSSVFRDDPARLIRVFRHAQRHGAKIHFDLQGLIRAEAVLLTPEINALESTNVSFKAILSEPGSVHTALSLMHELGVLGKFIPDFDGLTCLVQHEYYHRYTADIHTLNTIKELDLIYTKDDPRRLKYRAAVHSTGDPNILYLTLLLHDIGKARGIRGHAEAGVEIALPLLRRLKVDEPKCEIVAFIIRHHLLMARFWQKHDIDDAATVATFAQEVSEPDLLRFLYVHTYCDAAGTSADLWNSYKDTLHTQLYTQTLEQLEHGDGLKKRHQERLTSVKNTLIARSLPNVSEEEITAHFNLLPKRYFLNTDQPEIELHLSMVNQLRQTNDSTNSVGSARPVIEWRDDIDRSLTVVHVATWDRAGLFYKLAGAFNVAGLSILSSKAVSRRDQIAIDTFYVTEPGHGIVQSEDAQSRFNEALEQALVDDADLMPDIQARSQRELSKRRFNRDTGRAEIVQASFPSRVEAYHELSMKRTIVEVQAPDQIGLLFRVTRTIFEHQFDITFARIGTERHVAIDTFYIEDISQAEVSKSNRLEQLREALLEIVNPAETHDPEI